MYRSFIHLSQFLRPYSWRITAAVLLGIGTMLAGVGLLASSGYLISAAALQPPILDLLVVIVAVRFFGISRAVLRYGERLLSHDITFRLLMIIRSSFFRMIRLLPASGLHAYQSGSLLSSITSDVDELQNFYIRVFTPVIVACFVSMIAWYFLYQFSPPASWFTLFFLVINGAAVPLVIRYLARGYGRKQTELRSRMHQLVVEHTQGLNEIRLYGIKDEFDRRLAVLTSQLSGLEKRQARITGLQDSLYNWNMFLAAGLALFITTPLVLEGTLSGVMLALVILAVMASFEATQNLGTAFQYHESTEKAAENLKSLTRSAGGTESGSVAGKNDHIGQYGAIPAVPAGQKSGPVIFDAVRFGYGSAVVLDGVGFRIEQGGKAAVVGPTGSGKSTLINLLTKFYEPDCGHISIGGIKLSSVSPDIVRQMLSVVDQHTYIFNDSLRNNLNLAGSDYSDQEIRQVLSEAQLDQWYSQLPEGLDTIIGEHGKSVSGGERQRIAIARALLKKAPVWILDEPTANLDTITEKKIVQTIRRVAEKKMVLWVTHRLEQMDYFDRILVMEEGRITQRGNHQQLKNRDGWYRSMLHIESDRLVTDA